MGSGTRGSPIRVESSPEPESTSVITVSDDEDASGVDSWSERNGSVKKDAMEDQSEDETKPAVPHVLVLELSASESEGKCQIS